MAGSSCYLPLIDSVITNAVVIEIGVFVPFGNLPSESNVIVFVSVHVELASLGFTVRVQFC